MWNKRDTLESRSVLLCHCIPAIHARYMHETRLTPAINAVSSHLFRPQAKFHCTCKRSFVTLVSSPGQVSFNLQTRIRHTCFVPKPSSIVLDNAVSSPLFRPQAKLHCTCKRGFVTLVSSPSRVSLQLQKRFRHICFVPELSFIALAFAVSSPSFHTPPSPIALANAGSSHFRVHGRVCCCGFHVLLRIMEGFYGLGRSLGRLLGRSLGRSFGFVA